MKRHIEFKERIIEKQQRTSCTYSKLNIDKKNDQMRVIIIII